jgi:hypothetical protein
MAGALPNPYFKDVLDALARPLLPHRDVYLRIRDLCVAVEARRVGDIRRTLEVMVRTDTSLEVPYQLIPAEVFYETMFRILALDRQDLMCGLIQWYGGFAKSLQGSRASRQVKVTFSCAPSKGPDSDDNYEGNNWSGMIDRFTRPLPSMGTAELEVRRKVVERALTLVIPIFEASPDPLPRRASVWRTPVRQALGEGLIHLFEVALNVYHLLLEQALENIASPGAVPGALSLPDLDRRWQAFLASVMPPPTSRTRLVSVSLPTTVTEVSGQRAFLLDAFEPHTARRFEFGVYNREESASSAEPKPIPALDAVRLLEKRIDFFMREFGHKPLGGTGPDWITPKDRRTFVAGRKRPSLLRSDDDIARFACDLFLDQLTARPKRPARSLEDAWDAVVAFISHFFNTQTSHTGLNLADEKVKYIGVAFPRDIAGRELHDCGVYAMRLVNILLQLSACTSRRKEHHLDFHITFIILPLHVGLIVEPKRLPPLFVHNQQITGLTADVEKTFHNLWKSTAGPADPDPAGAAALRRKFLEDLAAQLFARDTDLPLLPVALTGVAVPPTKGQLDVAYQRLVVTNYPRLFSNLLAKVHSDVFNFDTEFLEAQQVEIDWYNEEVLRLWNQTAHDLWHRTARRNAFPTTQTIRERYAKALEADVDAVVKAYDDVVLKHRRKLADDLRRQEDQILARPRPRITYAPRLPGLVRELGPLSVIRQHIDDVRAGGTVLLPPFADPAFRLVPIRD